MIASPEKLCNNCGASARFACNGCNMVFYCGKDCQRSSWKIDHKGKCARVDIAAPAAPPAVPAALPAVPKKPLEDINCLLHDILGITNSFAWRKTFFGLNAYGQKCIVIETETGDGWERDCYADGDDRENIHQMIDDYRSHEWSTDEVNYPGADNHMLQVFLTIPSTHELKEYITRLDSDELNQYDLDEIVSAFDDADYEDYIPPDNDDYDDYDNDY